jgi:hypothetical protein
MDVIIVMNENRSKGSKRLNPNFLIRDHPWNPWLISSSFDDFSQG